MAHRTAAEEVMHGHKRPTENALRKQSECQQRSPLNTPTLNPQKQKLSPLVRLVPSMPSKLRLECAARLRHCRPHQHNHQSPQNQISVRQSVFRRKCLRKSLDLCIRDIHLPAIAHQIPLPRRHHIVTYGPVCQRVQTGRKLPAAAPAVPFRNVSTDCLKSPVRRLDVRELLRITAGSTHHVLNRRINPLNLNRLLELNSNHP